MGREGAEKERGETVPERSFVGDAKSDDAIEPKNAATVEVREPDDVGGVAGPLLVLWRQP